MKHIKLHEKPKSQVAEREARVNKAAEERLAFKKGKLRSK